MCLLQAYSISVFLNLAWERPIKSKGRSRGENSSQILITCEKAKGFDSAKVRLGPRVGVRVKFFEVTCRLDQNKENAQPCEGWG